MEKNPTGSNEDGGPGTPEIIGEECKGPLETQLTETVVKEYLITITKPEYDEFIKPFLTENDQEKVENDGIPVIMYGYQDVKKELPMILKEHKSGDFDGMYVLTGSQNWKDLCNMLIQFDAFVNIWMFRRAGDRNLCSAITLARFGLPSSKIIIQKNQEPRSSYHDIVGKWSGPLSKQLRNSDVQLNYPSLIFLKKHYEEFMEPLLKNHTFDLNMGVQVTMYSTATPDVKTQFLMNLKVRGSDQYVLPDGWKDFCQKHEFMIKVDEFVTLWMFLRKNEENPSLCSIITSGRVVEEEKYNLPAFPPVASLYSLIEKCSKPFVKTLTKSDVNERREIFLVEGKTNFVTYLEPLLNISTMGCGCFAIK